MKLVSTKTNKNGIALRTDDLIFDISLLKLLDQDSDENAAFITLSYDALEMGNPLGLPSAPSKATLCVRATKYTQLRATLYTEGYPEGDDRLFEYYNEFGGIEFNVRLSCREELKLMKFIALELIKRAA